MFYVFVLFRYMNTIQEKRKSILTLNKNFRSHEWELVKLLDKEIISIFLKYCIQCFFMTYLQNQEQSSLWFKTSTRQPLIAVMRWEVFLWATTDDMPFLSWCGIGNNVHLWLVSLLNSISMWIIQNQSYPCRSRVMVLYLTHRWGDKEDHTFPKGISPKVSVMAKLGFEHIYYDITAHHISD